MLFHIDNRKNDRCLHSFMSTTGLPKICELATCFWRVIQVFSTVKRVSLLHLASEDVWLFLFHSVPGLAVLVG